MKKYYPEGTLFESRQNKKCMESINSLRECFLSERILEGKVTLCDREHNLYVDLGVIQGVIPREECAIGISDGSVRDIAIISRVNKPVTFKIIDFMDDETIVKQVIYDIITKDINSTLQNVLNNPPEENNEEYLVCGNGRTKITEKDGRSHMTNEPAVLFFYKNHWFNIIGQLKKFGLFYYCNIASPYIIDGKSIKYIDYDLDLRVFPDGGFRILDRNEYNFHKKIMKYPDTIYRI